MISRLIRAVIYCLVIFVVAWIITLVVAVIPLPPPIAGVASTIIWAIAGLLCLIALIHVFFPSMFRGVDTE